MTGVKARHTAFTIDGKSAGLSQNNMRYIKVNKYFCLNIYHFSATTSRDLPRLKDIQWWMLSKEFLLTMDRPEDKYILYPDTSYK